MFRKNTKNTLDTTNPDVFDMILKIVQEREYDIPNTFIKYITDDMFISLVTDEYIDIENVEKLVDTVYPYLQDQYFTVFSIIYIYCKDKYAHMFPQMMVAKVIKSRHITMRRALDCVYNIISHGIYVEPCIVYALLTKELGPFLLLRRWNTLCSTIEDILNYRLHLSSNEMEYLLPALYDMIPKRVIRDREDWKSRVYLYDTGRMKKFIYRDATLEEIYVYMDNYVSNECTHEIPRTLLEALYEIDNPMATKLTEQEKFDIYKIKKLIQKSVALNANNANIIYWLTGEQYGLMLLDIASSQVPIRDISIFMQNIGLRKIDDSTMERLIQGGIRLSTLIPYMSDIKKFLDIIFSFDIFHNYVFDDRLSDITNIENASKNEYLLDILSIDYDIIVNDIAVPFVDYLIQYNIIQERIVLLTVNHTLMSNRELFMKLQTDTTSILMEGKDKSVYTQYPATIISSVYQALSQTEINDMIIENPEVASYIPSRFIDIPTILASIKMNTTNFIPMYHSLTEPIRSDLIISMVTSHDVGYGYIADVNTEVQTLAIIEAILDYQTNKSYIENE